MGEMERPPHDPARMRIGDKERNQVAELLQRAAGDGRLDFDELEERLEATWSAKTYGDLVPITADLPTLASSDAMAVPSSSAPVFDTHAPAPASRPSASWSTTSSTRSTTSTPSSNSAGTTSPIRSRSGDDCAARP